MPKTAISRTDALLSQFGGGFHADMIAAIRKLEDQFNYAVERADFFERENAELREALESAAASIQQLVDLGRIPASNKGLRDARALLARMF